MCLYGLAFKLIEKYQVTHKREVYFDIKGPFGYNWKLKTEKHCSKIIFKYVNSTVGPIFNEKIAEKWNLWVREQCTVCTDWLKRMRKVKLYGYCSLNSAWTVAIGLTNACQKKEKRQMPNANAQSKRSLTLPRVGLRSISTYNVQVSVIG